MCAGVFLKASNFNLKKDVPFISLSPCLFKKSGKHKAFERKGLEMLDSSNSRMVKNMLLKTSSDTFVDQVDWSVHDEVIAALSCESPCKEDSRDACQSDDGKGLKCLLRAWFLSQVDAIACNGGEEVSSVLLGNKTLLQFQVKGYKRGSGGKLQATSYGSLEDRNKTVELPIEFSYLLSISDESLHNGKVYAYEIAFNERNENLGGLLENLNLGDPVSYYPVQERTSDKGISSDLSSMTWTGTTASDIVNSRYSLPLNTFSGFFLV